jgi:hypothetical protein
MTLRQMLAADGIRSMRDIDARRDPARQSRYDYLVSCYGQENADHVMRIAEVASWDMTLPGGAS